MLEDFINDSNPMIQNIAVKQKQIIDAYNQGLITQSEYSELTTDLLSLTTLNNIATSVEERSALLTAINQLRTLVGIATSL